MLHSDKHSANQRKAFLFEFIVSALYLLVRLLKNWFSYFESQHERNEHAFATIFVLSFRFTGPTN